MDGLFGSASQPPNKGWGSNSLKRSSSTLFGNLTTTTTTTSFLSSSPGFPTSSSPRSASPYSLPESREPHPLFFAYPPPHRVSLPLRVTWRDKCIFFKWSHHRLAMHAIFLVSRFVFFLIWTFLPSLTLHSLPFAKLSKPHPLKPTPSPPSKTTRGPSRAFPGYEKQALRLPPRVHSHVEKELGKSEGYRPFPKMKRQGIKKKKRFIIAH